MSEDRVTELQADNTRLITDLRETRAKLIAARKLLMVVCVEGPLQALLALQTGQDPSDVRVQHREILDVYYRIELLEKDAWTTAGPLARQFVKAAKSLVANAPTPDVLWGPEGSPVIFIDEWAEKFAAVVGD